ncbi:hypothetical protein [Acidiferrobacter sp.]|uniref:TOTE conflict system archaeo-eukaryotic primase domain-containing protein n=1 Tax=Acidiferrobacter sp. TaxID=1872107 RepID=UPI002613D35B|nr:hypothetical protein [Acidiferrobacter sp.]
MNAKGNLFGEASNSSLKGGYGNLIALPWQKDRRAHGTTVFVDESPRPYDDQWLSCGHGAPAVV